MENLRDIKFKQSCCSDFEAKTLSSRTWREKEDWLTGFETELLYLRTWGEEDCSSGLEAETLSSRTWREEDRSLGLEAETLSSRTWREEDDRRLEFEHGGDIDRFDLAKTSQSDSESKIRHS